MSQKEREERCQEHLEALLRQARESVDQLLVQIQHSQEDLQSACEELEADAESEADNDSCILLVCSDIYVDALKAAKAAIHGCE